MPSPPIAKQPPQSKEAEEAVIASLIVDDSQWHGVAANLVASDFMFDSCRMAYASMATLKARGEAINEITLPAEMARAGTYEQAGGDAFLARIGEETLDVRHAVDSAREVKRLSLNRKLIDFGGKLAQLGFSNMADPTKKMSEAQAGLMELAARFNPSAVLTPEERARRMSDRYLDLSEKPEYVLEWPFELLTKHCSGIYPGEYWAIAGETGGGKTTLLNRLVFQWAKVRPALVCNTEMTWEAMGDRHVADITGLTIKEIRGGGYSDETSAKIQDACGEVAKSDIYHLYLGAHDNGLAAIRQQAKQLQAAHGLGCIAVDYLQEVKIQLGNRASSYDRTTAVSAGLREIGRDLRVPVVAISSLNRHSSSRPTASKLPQLSDLRGSGDIEFQADGVIFLSKATTISSKEEDKNLVILQLAKNRAEGAIGRVDLVWSESDRLHRQSVMN